MSDRDIIIRLAAEVMGWELSPDHPQCGCEWSITAQRMIGATCVSDTFHHHTRWNPLESWGDVMEIEGKLPLGRRHAYLRELCYITDAFMDGIGSTALHERDWKLLSATPRQRCEAMIAVLGKP